MNEIPQQRSRMSIIRDQAADGTLRKSAISLAGRKILSIEKLVEDPDNERKTFDDMDALVASIKAVNGLVEPPTVVEIGDDQYQIVTGHRRFRAAKLAGLTQIEVLIREPEEKWERRKKSLISNVQRADIRAIELAESLKLLLDSDPSLTTQDDLAVAIGKPKSWVSDMLRIRDLPEDLKEKVRTSELFIPADAVSKIARIEDHAVQSRLVDELLSGANIREIRQQINVHKGKAPRSVEDTPAAKPKWVFHTAFDADIIIQSKKSHLTREQRIAALTDALEQAKTDKS